MPQCENGKCGRIARKVTSDGLLCHQCDQRPELEQIRIAEVA